MKSIYQLGATVFPGGYRFLVVNVVALICASEVSDFFSSSFFMVSLLATFSGVAVSTQSYVLGRSLYLTDKLILTLVLLCLAALACYGLWVFELESYVIPLLAAYCYSVFEIARSEMAAEGRFLHLVIAGILSILIFVPVAYFLQDQSRLLVVFTFIALMVPALCMRNGKEPQVHIDAAVIKDVSSYSLSNGLSTGVSFALPLLLAQEFGEGGSTMLAQVFTLSALFVFYPRYLSSGFLVCFKGNHDWGLVRGFEKKVFVYTLIVSLGFGFVSSVYLIDYFMYQGLFVAIVASQLSLPYSNVMMIFGAGSRMLFVNFVGLIVLVVILGGIYYSIDVGELRGMVMLWAYAAYVAVRAVFLRQLCYRTE